MSGGIWESFGEEKGRGGGLEAEEEEVGNGQGDGRFKLAGGVWDMVGKGGGGTAEADGEGDIVDDTDD
eukprot:60956-Amorphochlora_amoeboformis.AAC.1